jgi:tetratricopeptide (TPR) repeat protein
VIAVSAVVLLSAVGALWRWARTAARAAAIARLCESGTNFTLLKKWGDAEKDFTVALTRDPDDIKTLLALAWMKLEHNKAQPELAGDPALIQAETAARRVVELHPTDLETLVKALGFQGVALRRLKRYPEALAVSEQCVIVAPSVYHNWSNLGALHAINDDLTKAEECIREGAKRGGVEQDQWHAAVWRNLAALTLHLGKPETLESLSKARACDDKDSRTWVLQALAQLKIEGHVNVAGALEDAKYADRLGKYRDAKAKRVLAIAHLRNNEYEDAITEARAAIELKDMPTANQLVIAIAEAKRGQVRAARDVLATVESTWPEKLRQAGGFIATAETGDLWIESADGLIQLKTEAEAAIAGTSGSQP